MAPVTSTIRPLERVKSCPTTDPVTKQCVVCGLTNAHEWKCIIWFISASVEFHKKQIALIRPVLEKLKQNRYVSDADVTDAIDRIKYVESLGEGLKE